MLQFPGLHITVAMATMTSIPSNDVLLYLHLQLCIEHLFKNKSLALLLQLPFYTISRLK